MCAVVRRRGQNYIYFENEGEESECVVRVLFGLVSAALVWFWGRLRPVMNMSDVMMSYKDVALVK